MSDSVKQGHCGHYKKKDEILCQAVVISREGKTPPDLESEKQLLYSFDGSYKAKVTAASRMSIVIWAPSPAARL